mgnify:CR=1 FL=1
MGTFMGKKYVKNEERLITPDNRLQLFTPTENSLKFLKKIIQYN